MNLLEAIADGAQPAAEYTVSTWADNYRILPTEGSVEPGRYRTSRTPYCREIMDALSVYSEVDDVTVIKGTQLGLALSIETPIATTTGWKKMKDIQVGDMVFDENGTPCKVKFTSEIMTDHNCYAVYFNDHSVIVADEDHRWSVWDEKKYEYRNRVVLRTSEIAKTFKNKIRNRYAIDVAKPLNCKLADLPIKPYLFGYWLGDGHHKCNRITIDKSDSREVLSYILNEGTFAKITDKHSRGNCTEIVFMTRPDGYCQRGHKFSKVGYISGNRCRECHRQISRGHGIEKILYPKEFKNKAKRLGVFGNKHIPAKYLRASYEQRMALLCGLMDSDGHITKDGYCEFYSTNQKLVNGVYELLCTVGYKPYLKKKKRPDKNFVGGVESYNNGPLWRITFKAFKERPVCKLSRKKDRLKSENEGRPQEAKKRRIVNVKPTGSVPVKCIQVNSKSHLYLAGESMIPTHNTELGNNWFGYIVDTEPGPMLMVFPTDKLATDHSTAKLGPCKSKM